MRVFRHRKGDREKEVSEIRKRKHHQRKSNLNNEFGADGIMPNNGAICINKKKSN